jgi:hypothetical protein
MTTLVLSGQNSFIVFVSTIRSIWWFLLQVILNLSTVQNSDLSGNYTAKNDQVVVLVC